MSVDSASREELSQLLSALEDGLLDLAGQTRLEALLKSSPEARARYYDHIMLSALLRREGRRVAAGQASVPQGTTAQKPVETVARARRSSPAWLALIAASALMVLALVIGEATGVTHVVPTIVRIVTGEGSLVIEVDDPSISVQLDGSDVTIKGAGIHELRLRPGEHKFVATRDGQPLREEAVVIERGGRQVVKVSRTPADGSALTVDRQQVGEFSSAAEGQSRLLAGHRGCVWNVAFAGSRLLTCGEDRWVRVWDIETGKEVQRFDGHASTVYALAVSPNGKWALSGSGCNLLSKEESIDWTVCLWEIETGKELQRLEGQGLGVTSVAISRDGSQALVGEFEGTVRLMDVEKWSESTRFSTAHRLWSVCFSPDSQRALTAGAYGGESVVRLWNLPDGKEVQRYVGHKFGMWHAAFLPSGNSILTAGQDETMRQWDAESGAQLQMFRHGGQVARIAVSTDGRLALTGAWCGADQKNLRLWRLDTAQEVYALAGQDSAIHSVGMSADGRWAASGASDGSVRLWRIPANLAAETAAQDRSSEQTSN